MASSAGDKFKKVRDKAIDNIKVVLQERGGKMGMNEIWQAYSMKFRCSLSKRDLGLNKMSDLIALYKKDFEVKGDTVIFKGYLKTDKYGMPLPSPIKPLWGAGATSGPGPSSRAASSGSSGRSTPQRGKAKQKRGGALSQASSNASISVSSDTDSDSDSDVKVTDVVPPSRGAAGDRAGSDSSGFLSFDVPQSKGLESFDVTPARQLRQPMVFNNQNMESMNRMDVGVEERRGEGLPSMGRGRDFETPGRPMQPQQPPLGRGRDFEMPGRQMQSLLPAPLMGMRFPVPQVSNQGNRTPHPGVMAAFTLQNNHPDQSQSSRAASSESDSSFTQPPDGERRDCFQPPPPPEPTWPPTNPKLGVPPGIPREKKQVTVKPVSFQHHHLTKEQVSAIAEECIELLVEAENFVSPDRIIHLLLQRFGVRDLRELQVPGLRYPYHIQCVNDHERLLAKVNASIEAFVLSRSICTLYDLEQTLIEFNTEGQKSFESLRLGPLQCLPIVYDKFKFPAEEKIPDITTADVLEALSEYLTKNHKWTERLQMEEVLAYFVDHYHIPTAYSLGIRIRSLPLAAQVLKKSHRDAANTRKSVVSRCMAAVHEEVAAAFQRAKANLFQTVQVDDREVVELRRHYFQLNAEVVMMELLEKFHLLLSLDTPTTKSERRRHSNIEQAVNLFLTTMKSEPLGRALLHLSVCVGRLDLQEAAMELLSPKSPVCRGPSGAEAAAPADQHKAKQPPSKAMLMEKMKRYVERCLAQGMLSLSHLDRIEEKLLEDFDFPTFNAMGFGRFLHFLLHDPAPKALLDECGGVSLGGSHHAQGRAHLTELLEFLRQCKAASLTEESDAERALCHQFHVSETRHLGYGNVRHLVEASEKPGKHQSKDYRILYEAAFCGKSSEPVRGRREVGMLGHQTREAALACLQSCPFLEDLEKWSHWSTVFEPQYGSLKDFLQKYGGVHTIHTDGGQKTITTDIIALETQPGCLLRLVSSSTPQQYETAAHQGDARATCGHLASLVMANRGVEHTPLALLANHTRAALFVLHTSSDVPGGPGGQSGAGDPAIQFVLHCLLLLPLRLCLALANQVFLEPLGQVVGSTRSKALLMEACRSSHVQVTNPASSLPQMALAQLGCMLGIQEWTTFLTNTFTFPPECVTVQAPQAPAPRDELLGDDDDVEEEEEESEEESEEVEESSASFLSDEEEEEEEKKEETTKAEEEAEAPEEKLDVANKEETSSEEESEDSSEDEDDEDEEMEAKEETEDDKVKKTTADGDAGAEDEELSGDSDAEEDIEPVDPCQQVIDQIRRDEFGVGVELNEDGQRLMKVQQERLGRSLDRLSRDLYSKDTHFVLELVQNADDNSYPEELMASLESTAVTEECPSVQFVIDKEGVTVLNNESGFREKDVRALCDVGRSTKGKHKYGYIGQKGIGFKSVFRVTSRPEIHSSGFHMCFDVDSGPMGYILPHWCEDKDPQEGWMTKIVLPLKEEMVSEARSLAARFNDIHPSLLLFLHRLRSICIDNKVEGSQLSMRRVDHGENIVEIHHSQGVTDRWLVVKKQLDASAISLQAKSGVEVESTEIGLAFPLKTSHHHSHVAPDKQPVFAFLPLRSYGFRFIVQGDFDVPSSREDVDRDSSWNQWLRNEIHTLFIEAFDVFRAHPEFEGFQSLWSYLQFVPLEDEILDFFKPVATQILKKIRATPCMPTISSSAAKTGTTQWKLPSQTVMVQDALVHEVISPELLERHLGLYYVHREVVSMLSSALTRSLGMESITSEHLIQVGRSLASAWGENVGDEQVVQIAKWLACVYRSMDDFQENTTLINTLRGMKVIPLSTGQLVALSEVTVFMLTEGNSETGRVAPGKRDPLSVLRQDLEVVHGRLMATADSEVNSQVTKLLHKLDMKQLSAQDIIHHHILPVLRSQQWQSKDRAVLVSYLIYIKEQRSRNPSLINMDELKTVARVLTNHGIKNPATENVHFRPSYGVNMDLQQILPGYDWTVVDDKYLPHQASKAEVVSWQEFFSQLGVTSFLIVRPHQVHLKREDIDSSPWAPLKSTWPATEETFTIPDYVCEELQELVSNNTNPASHLDQMKVLFSLLDSAWDTQYMQYATTQLQSGQRGTVVRDNIPSSFAVALQTLRWVPGIESMVITAGDVMKIEEKRSLLPPSLLYVQDPQIKRLLAHMAYYLDVPVSSTSSFSRFLHIKSCVETKVVHDALIEWGKRDEASPNTPATFYSTLAHLKAVYIYLFENLTRKESQDLFHQNPVIFVPKKEVTGVSTSHQRVVGRMVGREEVWWQDTSGLFRKYQPTLIEFHSPLADRHPVEHLYRDIAEPFSSAARLQQEPTLADFAELLTLIAAGFSLKEEGLLSDILSIYARIGHAISLKHDPNTIDLNIQKEQAQKVMTTLKGQKVLATKRHTWVSTADKPMIVDDPELERMFANKDKVHFIMVEPPKAHQQRSTPRRRMGGGRDTNQVDVDSILAFMALFNIRQLSEEVEKEEILEMFQPCTSGQLYMHTVVPYIQCYLLAYYPDIQDAHHDAGMAARLKQLLFVKTKKLQVRYSLKSLPDVYEIRDEKCVITRSHFYFHEKHIDSTLEVSTEVARFFSDGNTSCMKDLRHFLLELQPLLEKDRERDLRRLLDRNGVNLLPDGFLPWEVPEPIIVRPPTPPPPPPPPAPTPTPGTGNKAEGDQSEGPSLRAWPPPAPGEHRESSAPKKQGEGKPMGASIWPPPQAPEEVKRRRELPSNLHMAPRSSGTSDSADQDPSAAPSGHPRSGSASSGHAPATAGGGGGGGGAGVAYSEHAGGQRREGVDRQGSREGERSVRQEGEGGGDGPMKRLDSGILSGKRKSGDLGMETSESKRPAPEEVVSAPPEAPGDHGQESQAPEPQGDVQMVGEEQTSAAAQDQQQQQQRRPGSITRKGWPPYRPRPDQLQLPVWTQLASETEYEELGRGGDLKIPTNVTLTESSNRVEVGRWGELLVFDYLLQQKEMHSDIYDVIWMNQAEESGKPYDFEVVCSTEDEAYTVFIEVKATQSSKKEVFEISSNEVKFASEHGERYHIYRIFNAGVTGQVQLVRLANVSHRMDCKEVRLLMVI